MTDRELLELIATQVGNLTTNMDTLNKDMAELTEGQNKIENEIGEFRKETNKNFDDLSDKLNNLEATNATNHVSIKARLNKVSDDLDFLSHKEFQTEREMYHIKQRLSKKKRNAK